MVTEAVEVRRKEEGIETRLKWRTLLLLSLAELLGMAVWFSASAVVPALTSDWSLNDSGRAWLTMSVQIGFVVGAFGSSLLNLADRIPARRLFTLAALLAGIFTALIPAFSTGLGLALVLRFLTGMVLAGVYPIGMKIMATWTKEDRGLGIGLLVGALTLGSASPHLINAFGGVGDWKPVLYLAAASAILGALIAILFVDEGPYRSPSPRFSWNHVGQILRQRDIILANLGYLGHMWELFAMWTWIPIFLLTLVTIRLVPNLVNMVGWNWAFAFLALGPAVGIWAMGTLRRSASASRLAGGKG